MSGCVIELLGDCALLIRVGNTLDRELNRRVHAIAAQIEREQIRGVTDVVPAFASVGVHVDPIEFAKDASLLGAVAEKLEDICKRADAENARVSGRHVEIPVCYGGEFGPDLPFVASQACMPEDQVVQRHHHAFYTVAMIGFAAGFPYLMGLPPELRTPRRANPRIKIPAGSVAIGGMQTGIYPRESPGGWYVIGRTPFRLFEPFADPPARLHPGDRVVFKPIEAKEFRAAMR